MGTQGAKPLTVPAGCDPQSRTFRLSWADILVGLLVVDDERFVFATPTGVVFNGLRSESTLTWRRGKAFGMIPQFDLSTPDGSFRLYLSRPSTTAPLYGESTLAEVGQKLSEAGDALGNLLDLLTKFGGVVQLAGAVGDFMEARADYREMRQGHAAASALRVKLSGQPGDAPSAGLDQLVQLPLLFRSYFGSRLPSRASAGLALPSASLVPQHQCHVTPVLPTRPSAGSIMAAGIYGAMGLPEVNPWPPVRWQACCRPA